MELNRTFSPMVYIVFFARIAQSARGYISQLFLSVSVRATHCQPVGCIVSAGSYLFFAEHTVSPGNAFSPQVCGGLCARNRPSPEDTFPQVYSVFCCAHQTVILAQAIAGGCCDSEVSEVAAAYLRTMSVVVLTLGAG